MAWFFIDDEIQKDKYTLDGENARHISKSLRMKIGEELTLVTPSHMQLTCTISGISNETVDVEVNERKMCENEPDVEITLYQALPKGDKFEYIIQKCVELGVTKIVPVISARCISRPDGKSLAKKQVRWQKIAREAAQQSRRGIVPEVAGCMTFRQAVEQSRENTLNIIFYELGGESVGKLLEKNAKSIGIFIGSEGGFEQNEVDLVCDNGGFAATLGRRILRAETAPLAALSILMYATGNFDTDVKTVKEYQNDWNNMRDGG